MSITDSFIPSKPVSFVDAEKIALQCASNVVRELNQYAEEYVRFPSEDGFEVVERKSSDNEAAIRRIAHVYLLLLHRKGLADF